MNETELGPDQGRRSVFRGGADRRPFDDDDLAVAPYVLWSRVTLDRQTVALQGRSGSTPCKGQDLGLTGRVSGAPAAERRSEHPADGSPARLLTSHLTTLSGTTGSRGARAGVGVSEG
ncbi:hypothetical protein GCM10022204_40400 [Microlunatus aurantiacus]|uniref:Uncharacterized protein n=1 Tax=Microlunatus aurantiacus TaxID=446786 RepID=A0ABP7ECH7_9ACTN